LTTLPFDSFHKDVEAANVGKITDTQSNALEQCSNSNDLAWHNGNCEHCKQAFKKRTTWQRFCSSLCREQAYFVKTGIKTGSLLKD